MRKLRKKNSGVTLIELMTVIIIMTMLTLMSMPMLSRFTRNLKLKNSSKIVASMLQLGKSLAITKNKNYWTRFDLDNDTVAIMWDNSGTDTLYGKVWKAPTLIDIRDISNTTTGTVDIYFTPKGTTDLNRSIHIEKRRVDIVRGTGVSAEERVKCYTLKVFSATGYVTIYPYGRNSPWSDSDL